MAVLKKLMSVTLALVMILSALPLHALAASLPETEREHPDIPENPKEEERIVLGTFDLDFIEGAPASDVPQEPQESQETMELVREPYLARNEQTRRNSSSSSKRTGRRR